MIAEVISKPIYRILSDLTQESRIDVALNLAVKDLLRLKLAEAERQQQAFALRYGLEWQQFKQSWIQGHIEEQHSHKVEADYWDWEAAVSDSERLQTMFDSLA